MNKNQEKPAKHHPNVKDITGQKFGSWTVISRAVTNGAGRNARWLCICDCGYKSVVNGNNLRIGTSSGCRECAKPKIGLANTIHGEHGCRTYSCWSAMRARAASNKTLAARRYAKRDLTICKRWLNYQNFVEDMGHCPSDKHSIDRINNDLGYSKSNCRWATQIEQQRNKSSNRIVEYKGLKMCVAEFAELLGARYHRVARQVRLGWATDRIAEDARIK